MSPTPLCNPGHENSEHQSYYFARTPISFQAMPMLNRFSKESSSTIIVCQPQTLQTWCPGELTFNCLFTPPPTLYKIDLFVDESQREEIILNLLLVFRSLVCLLLPLVEVSHGGWQDNLRPRYHHHNHDNHRNHHHESFIPLQSTQWFHPPPHHHHHNDHHQDVPAAAPQCRLQIVFGKIQVEPHTTMMIMMIF